jgi:hypothetical protein
MKIDRYQKLVLFMAIITTIALVTYPVENEIFRAIAVSNIGDRIDKAADKIILFIDHQHRNLTGLVVEQANDLDKSRQNSSASLRQYIHEEITRAVNVSK